MKDSGPFKQTGCDFTINAGQKFEIFTKTILESDRYVFNVLVNIMLRILPIDKIFVLLLTDTLSKFITKV